MYGRVSPKFNLMQIAAMQKKSSPRSGGDKKVASPSVPNTRKKNMASPKASRSRASWNIGLEKALVQLLHDHNNESYRGQNGWTSEAWNRIVRKFHEQFSYVSFTKLQIQDKEKELKRDYKLLKEARKQSGVQWDEKLCMIKADPPIWKNIINSYPKANKFQRISFPLFETLGELYDGKTAEGHLAFLSIAQKESEPAAEHQCDEDLAPFTTEENIDVRVHQLDEDDEEVRILDQFDERSAATSSRRTTSTTREKVTATRRDEDVSSTSREKGAGSRAKVGKAGQKRKTVDDVAEIMGKYVEVKTKQVEGEAAEAAEFSIKNCNALLATIEELSGEDRADAYDVFKDAQNREIFMTADPSSRLIWLRRKIRLINSSS